MESTKPLEEAPLTPRAMGRSDPTDEPQTVIVRRRIKAGCEADFETAMRDFIDFALGFPGHREIHVVRPASKQSREYTVVDKFADPQSRERFKTSAEYREWMRRLGELTEGEATIEEMGGLAGWFTLPDEPSAKPPPKHKMAMVTFLGVFPLSLLLPRVLKPMIAGWPPVLVSALISACIVAALTWLVMPFLTRVFRPWLFQHPANS